MNQLESLKRWTTVVADTGDFQQIAQFKPQDATTNPSLILKAVQKPEYSAIVEQVRTAGSSQDIDDLMDRLIVRFGCEILQHVPGRVSTEVDARLSFDEQATYVRAKKLIDLYKSEGVQTADRVLIKIAATWEGIQAAKRLEAEGIHTNLTLLFSKVQAIACADANVRLISPFVGRIYDWYKKKAGDTWDEIANSGINDPGVQSVSAIFEYYKSLNIQTEVMGASFRNIRQIIALAGCDLLTISPDLLAELQTSNEEVNLALNRKAIVLNSVEPVHYSESAFRFALNEDAMSTEKLAEGIRAFVADAKKLEQLLKASKS